MPNNAYFVIADVTGYTAFLTGSELEHAQDILKTLFNTLLDNIKPPLLISNYQGDAILTYVPDGSFVQGQTLLENIENIYCAFAQTLENMVRNTTCTCQACRNIPKLDLKLFVHYGEYVIQQMRDKQELSGPDVILVHRMMKNQVKERLDLVAYTLFTESAIKQLKLEDFTCEMQPYSDSYEHIGEVKMYAYCLKTMWEREHEKRRNIIEPENAWFVVNMDLPVPPSIAWEYINEPQFRTQWTQVENIFQSGIKQGRVGVGTVNHCAHGEKTTVDFAVLDWRPFEYKTEMMTGFPVPVKISVCYTMRFIPIEKGTRVAVIFDHLSGANPLAQIAARLMKRIFYKKLREPYIQAEAILRHLIEQHSKEEKLAIKEPI